jgi:hypothetical protein
MRITSVLGHADSDDVPFVRRFFDESVSLGPSYLDPNKVIDAARSCGADAIHPGYGFLSERAELAAACEETKIIFVGPKASSIAAMGSKAESRHLMQRLDVPVIPGYDGAVRTGPSDGRCSEVEGDSPNRARYSTEKRPNSIKPKLGSRKKLSRWLALVSSRVWQMSLRAMPRISSLTKLMRLASAMEPILQLTAMTLLPAFRSGQRLKNV